MAVLQFAKTAILFIEPRLQRIADYLHVPDHNSCATILGLTKARPD